jgi:hypothetical protein
MPAEERGYFNKIPHILKTFYCFERSIYYLNQQKKATPLQRLKITEA